MRRTLTALVMGALAAAMMVGSPAQAVGTGVPVVKVDGRACPVASTGMCGSMIYTSGPTWDGLTIDFSNAPAGNYYIDEFCDSGSPDYADHGRWTGYYAYDGTVATETFHSPVSFTSPSGHCAASVGDGMKWMTSDWFGLLRQRAPFPPISVSTSVASHRATLRWAAADDGGSPVTAFQVQRGTDSTTRRTVAATARSASFTGLTNGRTYALYVRAKNALGYSTWAHASAIIPKAYSSCTAMHAGLWPHGVGRPDAIDHTSGPRVTTFAHSTVGYTMNNGRVVSTGEYDLDADNDGIACEKR